MYSKPFFATAIAATLTLTHAFAGGEGWTHDYAGAKKTAAESKKDLLIDFTGSDWCGWCIKLNDEVFKHEPFKTGTKDQFVLVELDFPRDKEKAGVTEEIATQNQKLQKDYGIRGFPSILLCDASGRPYAATGYRAGGPEEYVKHLTELRAKRTARDEAFTKAASQSGPEKAKTLVAALKDLNLQDAAIQTFYPEIITEIKSSDPQDESGYIKNLEAKARFSDFESKLNGFGSKQDHEGALNLVDETLAANTFEGAQKQQILAIRASILASKGSFDEALKSIEDAKAVDPESDLGKNLDSFKARLEQMKEAASKNTEEKTEEKTEESK